ncbi:MAG: hypothetical protein JWO97_890, partial [Acidobacteria bacterium]|nr:hypothetical protein [Acidobacteriota bacterium]
DPITASYAKGKLLTAERYNYLGNYGGTLRVREAYTYAGRDGAISKRTTTVERTDLGSTQTLQTFEHSVTLDELGNQQLITYPTAANQLLGPSPSWSSITNSHVAGLLQSVNGFATLDYADDGTIYKINHAGGTVDTIDPDPSGMSRPGRIRFDNYNDCNDPQPAITAASSVCLRTTGNSATTASVPAATYSWSATNATITSGNATNAITWTAGDSGSITLSVTVTTGCGSKSATRTVTINGPTAIVSGTTTISRGQSATIQAALTGQAPWTVVWSDGTTQNNIQTPTVSRNVSPSSLTTYTVTQVSDAACGSGIASGSAVVTVTPPTPTGLTATLNATGTAITLNWTSTGANDTYIVQRSVGAPIPLDYAQPNAPTYPDNDPAIATGGVVTYVYRVLAVSGGTKSVESARVIVTRILFTDPTLTLTTPIRGLHVGELRQAIDAVRVASGYTRNWNNNYGALIGPILATTFYRATPQPASPDLLSALNEARSVFGLPAVQLAAPLPAPGAKITISHINALRGGVK